MTYRKLESVKCSEIVPVMDSDSDALIKVTPAVVSGDMIARIQEGSNDPVDLYVKPLSSVMRVVDSSFDPASAEDGVFYFVTED